MLRWRRCNSSTRGGAVEHDSISHNTLLALVDNGCRVLGPLCRVVLTSQIRGAPIYCARVVRDSLLVGEAKRMFRNDVGMRPRSFFTRRPSAGRGGRSAWGESPSAKALSDDGGVRVTHPRTFALKEAPSLEMTNVIHTRNVSI
jgi:hypothetical protein